MHITRIKKVEKKVRSDIRLYKASPEIFFFFFETMLNNGKKEAGESEGGYTKTAGQKNTKINKGEGLGTGVGREGYTV